MRRGGGSPGDVPGDFLGDWLGDADRIAALGRRLAGAGVPVQRLALYRRTLHPGVLARATAWSPSRPIEIFDRDHGLDLSVGFIGSPLDLVMSGGGALTLDMAEVERTSWSWADPFRGRNLRSMLVTPAAPAAALAVATPLEGGFGESDLALIERFSDGLAKRGNRQKSISQ